MSTEQRPADLRDDASDDGAGGISQDATADAGGPPPVGPGTPPEASTGLAPTLGHLALAHRPAAIADLDLGDRPAAFEDLDAAIVAELTAIEEL